MPTRSPADDSAGPILQRASRAAPGRRAPGRWLLAFLALIGLAASTVAAMVTFGGPSQPPALASINAPFRLIDFSDLPRLSTFRADDGTALAYRDYAPTAAARAGSVTLVHGSSASSNSMHPLARALAADGYRVYALDMRGHGASGPRGSIHHVGQLESDVAAFVRAVGSPAPRLLAGFSAGGGFVLRFAGSEHHPLFGSYLLLSPFVSQAAANYRPDSGGWVRVGLPRVLGLSALNAVGVRAFNDLAVTRFALNEEARKFLTPEYGFNLAMNFRPHLDYQANLRRVTAPVAIVAGANDEAFYTDKLEDMVRGAGKDWRVHLLPGVDHVGLIVRPEATAAIVAQARTLQERVQVR